VVVVEPAGTDDVDLGTVEPGGLDVVGADGLEVEVLVEELVVLDAGVVVEVVQRPPGTVDVVVELVEVELVEVELVDVELVEGELVEVHAAESGWTAPASAARGVTTAAGIGGTPTVATAPTPIPDTGASTANICSRWRRRFRFTGPPGRRGTSASCSWAGSDRSPVGSTWTGPDQGMRSDRRESSAAGARAVGGPASVTSCLPGLA